MSIELDCTDIIEIFKTHLKIENSVKSISHTFFSKNFDYPEKPLKYKHIRRISD